MLLQNSPAQTINDTVFNDVILINKDNVVADGQDFLIDIPIKVQENPIVIYNDDDRIPSKLFFERKSFLADQNEIIIITRDHKYHKEIIKTQQKRNIHVKPIPQWKIYTMKRYHEAFFWADSLTLDASKTKLKINFKKVELKEDEVKYFIKDCYGTTCCPTDEKYGFTEKINSTIKLFEEKNGVNIGNAIYIEGSGPEGEHCKYYRLSDLTNKQRLTFIKEMNNIIKKTQYAQIYTPIRDYSPQKKEFELVRMNLADDLVYNSMAVDIQPVYPDGLEKLYEFLSKNYVVPNEFAGETTCPGKVYVKFVIEKDGSLSDIIILRDIGYGTGKELLRVLKLAPKWIPAELNGRKVRCSYSIPFSIPVKVN